MSFVIGYSDYFGFGFTTLDRKPFYIKLINAGTNCERLSLGFCFTSDWKMQRVGSWGVFLKLVIRRSTVFN